MKHWNRRKPWSRMLSMILSLVMTISLLSGCGATSGQSEKQSQSELSQEVQDTIQSENNQLAKTCEQIENTLEQLKNELAKDSDGQTSEILQTLEEQLATVEEETSQWLATQEEAGKELSKDAGKALEERNKAFFKQLEENQKQANDTLNSLAEAVENGNKEEAQKLSDELNHLLVQEEAPKTYGESLPGEAEVYEPEVAELESTENEPDTEQESGEIIEQSTPAVLSETELSELLITEDDTELTDDLKIKTGELGTTLAIYNYLKNHISYEYYYGSRKGAAGTYEAQAGNDMDQASLLIAMLRYLGVEAKYVRGNIYLDEEQAMALTGADNITHASDILASAGTPVTLLTLNGEAVKLSMEHVWVRAYVPYTDYRGAGKHSGDKVWIDLDTSIKTYEEVENLYDIIETEGFREEAKAAIDAEDIAGMETMLDEWETKLSSMNLENVYARKRIIQQEDLSYLPLSLPYEVAEEIETFAQVKQDDKDCISFAVGGESLGTYTASELAGKDIILSFHPVSDVDAEILNSYTSIFDVPAHSVYLKPVLLVNGEVVAEGEDIGTTLGTSQNFSMNIHSAGKDIVVDNAVTTGSMYAVTLDNQSITGSELQRVYDEAAALKDSVTEANVYSEEYLGKMLALAGKLYFAQIDIADMVAAEIYDVSNTRSLSEGLTGYEVRTTSLYGMVTGITEGNLYIDVDTDGHSVVSLNGDEDVAKEYMFSTGMISSLYESTVWEELTGCESVSTISILAKAQEENIEILLLTKSNLDTEIEKLNTDETTKQTVINAVNSGKAVTIPATDITMGDWHGTGYIVTNMETGAGAYMISGGLNGGSLSVVVGIAFITNIILSLVDLVEAISLIITSIAAFMATAPLGTLILAAILVVIGVVCAICAIAEIGKSIWLLYRYINGDVSAGLELIEDAAYNILLTLVFAIGSSAAKHYLKDSVKKALYRIMGSDFVENMLKEFDDIFELYKYVKELQSMGHSVGVLIEISEAFGKKGLDWLLGKKGLGLTDDLVRKIIKVGNLDWFTDDVIRAILNSNGYADDIIAFIKKYGKDAADAIGKYGDDAVEALKEYGDDAIDGFKNDKTPDEIRADKDNANTGGGTTGGDTGTSGGTSGGDNSDIGGGTEGGYKSGLTQSQIDEILAMPKGSRPDPSTYLSKEYIEAHLALFDDGVSVIQTEWAYNNYSVANGFVGVPDDNTLFVMPKNYCDDVISKANGDISVIEKELGFQEGYFSDGGGLVRIDVEDIADLNVRIPSGNEAGANSLWIPGGYTSGGVPEAVTNTIPLSKTSIKRIEVE